MKPSIQTLGQILYSPSQYVIPVFQRNYRWEAPQWEKLWESLTEIQKPDKRGNHFMGFLVFVPGLPQPGQHTTFHLIDGQQRLTTSSILLAALRNVARDQGHAELADEIHHDFLVHPRKQGDRHFRLLPKERDHDSYLAAISGNGEPSGRVADALSWFEDRVAEDCTDQPELIRALFQTVCARLEFMCATLETENAYNIFKSLNSTGVPLGPSDLIRNFVFMHVKPDDHDEFDRALWSPLEDRFSRGDETLDEDRFSRFFRDFLMATGRYVSPKETFATFEARYEATDFRPDALTRELRQASDYYEIICGSRPDESAEVTRAIEGLNQLESATTYPLLLALFQSRAMGQLDSARLAQVIEMLRGFILRRYVCGESSRGYGQMFARAVPKPDRDPAAFVEAYLLERGWPADQQFVKAFAEFPLYQRDYAREVLVTLERAQGHKEPASLTDAQVEHVMPQTLSAAWRTVLGVDADLMHAEWLHRPGNLTLSAYNQSLWNHGFEIKRQRYLDSNIVLTKRVGEYSRWGLNEIRERGEALAAQAAVIWIGPKEAPKPPPPQPEPGDGPPKRLRLEFWQQLGDYFSAEWPELPKYEPRRNQAVRLPFNVRHIGCEMRFLIQPGSVGIDIWFWRAASLPLWERIRESPESWNELVGDAWSFDVVDGKPRARMFIERPLANPRSEPDWPAVFPWFGQKLSLVYGRVMPRLKQEMAEH